AAFVIFSFLSSALRERPSMNLTRRRPRLWWAAGLLTALPLLLLSSCKDETSVPGTDPEVKGDPWFEDKTADSLIEHTYRNGQDVAAKTLDGQPMLDKDTKQPVLDKEGHPIGHLAILESLGGGAGVLDFDRDGL